MRFRTHFCVKMIALSLSLGISVSAYGLPDLNESILELKQLAPSSYKVPALTIVEVEGGGIGVLGDQILVPKQIMNLHGQPVSTSALETLLFHEYGHVLFEANISAAAPGWKEVERERSRVSQQIFKMEKFPTESKEELAQLDELREWKMKLWEIIEIKRALHELAADLFAVAMTGDLSAVKSALQGTGPDHPESVYRSFASSAGSVDHGVSLSEPEFLRWQDEMDRLALQRGFRDPYLMFFPVRRSMGAKLGRSTSVTGDPVWVRFYFEAIDKIIEAFDRWDKMLRDGDEISAAQLNAALISKIQAAMSTARAELADGQGESLRIRPLTDRGRVSLQRTPYQFQLCEW